MIKRVHAAIRAYGLFTARDRVLVAVSGGADSVCLLTVLHDMAPGLGLELTVAHLDHRLRGAESRRDAAFVEDLAERLGVVCIRGSSDVRRRARSKGLSLEMAAREARYDFLARSARAADANVVATAHTADDQAETVLLKLVRGAGAGGLSGIARDTVLRGLRVVRPMLVVQRAEIEAFLRERKQAWREDVSNTDVSFLRNRIRHEVLPLLESRLNPSLRRTLCRTADVLSEEEKWLEDVVAGLAAICTGRKPAGTKAGRSEYADVLDTGVLAAIALGPRRRIVRRWLAAGGVPVEAIGFDAVARVNKLVESGRTGTSADIGGGWTVKNRYGTLVLAAGRAPVGARGFRCRLNVPGETVLPEVGLRIEVSIERGITRPARARAGELPACVSISRRAVGRKRLYIRSWRHGDRIKPLGLNGSKKIQDIFVNDKVPTEQRASVPLLECGGEVAWLPGYRIARGWEVTDAAKPAIQLRVERV